MQRLPKELRIVLGEVDDHEDIRAMASKADKLWSLHNHQQHGVVASVDPGPASSQPPATIAAVKSGPPARGGRSGGQRVKGRGRGGAGSAPKPTAATTPSAVVFRLAIGGRAESVSIDRLKPHLGTADVLPQRPPPRGREESSLVPPGQHWRGAMWRQRRLQQIREIICK
jgi:hypothetical protein